MASTTEGRAGETWSHGWLEDEAANRWRRTTAGLCASLGWEQQPRQSQTSRDRRKPAGRAVGGRDQREGRPGADRSASPRAQRRTCRYVHVCTGAWSRHEALPLLWQPQHGTERPDAQFCGGSIIVPRCAALAGRASLLHSTQQVHY